MTRDKTATETAKAGTDLEAERLRRQRMRSIAIAATLVGLTLLFYVATLVRLGGRVFNRAI